MPELPEVTTTVQGLQKFLPGHRITDAWTDLARASYSRAHFKDTLKDSVFFKRFKKKIIGSHVVNVERRAKNILINLSIGETILIHMKMTGHIMYGAYVFDKKRTTWSPADGEREALFDPFNKFLHFVLSFSNGKQMVLSDVRKFAKVTLVPTKEIHTSSHLSGIGPEPLERDFTCLEFKKQILRKPTGNIKTVLMDQSVIAGIGNIYSDEMLWLSGIHPESAPNAIPGKKLSELYTSMKIVLKKGIDFGGDSTSDYRDVHGERGRFQSAHNVYRKKGEKCGKRGCRGVILRKVIGGRSAHFCSIHQKLYAKNIKTKK